MLTIYGVLVVIVIVGAIVAPRFTSSQNLFNVLLQAVALGLVAIGQTMAILSGGLDLSVGATISMVAVYSSGLMAGREGIGVFVPVLLLTLVMALAVGFINGQLVSKLRVPAFIATLSMGAVVQGVVLLYAKRPVGGISPEWSFLANATVGPVPVGVIFLALALAVAIFILGRTVLGRYVYAVGGNVETARLSGIRTARILTFAYMASSFMAAMSAFFLISRMGIGDPQVGGLNYQAYDLESIASVLIGGTVLGGGAGGVIGTIAGVLIITVLNNIFNLVGISAFYQWIFKGAIMIAAVAVYRSQRRR